MMLSTILGIQQISFNETHTSDQTIITEHLLCARPWDSFQGYKDEQNLVPALKKLMEEQQLTYVNLVTQSES